MGGGFSLRSSVLTWHERFGRAMYISHREYKRAKRVWSARARALIWNEWISFVLGGCVAVFVGMAPEKLLKMTTPPGLSLSSLSYAKTFEQHKLCGVQILYGNTIISVVLLFFFLSYEDKEFITCLILKWKIENVQLYKKSIRNFNYYFYDQLFNTFWEISYYTVFVWCYINLNLSEWWHKIQAKLFHIFVENTAVDFWTIYRNSTIISIAR